MELTSLRKKLQQNEQEIEAPLAEEHRIIGSGELEKCRGLGFDFFDERLCQRRQRRKENDDPEDF